MPVFPLKRPLTCAQVGSETVVFNGDQHRVTCLNQVSAVIWELCDGTLGIPALAELASFRMDAPVSAEIVGFALNQLRGQGLLEQDEISSQPAISRRALVQRLGHSAALLLPVVAMVAVPRQAQASGGGGCVPAETPIQLAQGGSILASGVRAGMWLRAFDVRTGQRRDGMVQAVQTLVAPAMHRLCTERGDFLQSSPSHLLIAAEGNTAGTPVSSLRAGDTVMVYRPHERRMVPDRLSAVQISSVPCPVYAIEMASLEHTYVSAGLVSHNSLVKIFSRPGAHETWDHQVEAARDHKESQDFTQTHDSL